MVNVISVKINLLKEFGEISEKRIKAVSEFLNEDYPSVTPVPLGVLFFNAEKRKHILFTSNQISFAQEGVKLEPDFTRLRELSWKIFDVLMIDNTSNVSFDYIGLIPGVQPTLADSLKLLDPGKSRDREKISSIDGLGLRFFCNLEGNRGDFRVEPYMQDSQKYFLQLQLSPNDMTISLDKIFIDADRFFKEFTGNFTEFAVSAIK